MRNKIMTVALATLVGATFAMASQPVKKAKAKSGETKPATTITLKTSSDSLSYAAGMSMTEGLIPYLQGQLGVDTAYLADFVRGLKDALPRANDNQFKAYAAGLQIAQMLETRMIPAQVSQFKDSPDSINTSLFKAAFIAALEKKGTIFTDSTAKAYFEARFEADKAAKEEKLYGSNRKACEEWLAANAKKDSVVTLPDGLQYKILVKGNGPVPKATDRVTVKYEGKLIDGTVFDSSYERNPQTNTFGASDVIKGWTEALTMMPVGSTWELYIPQQLAYGSRQAGKITPYSALIFKLELISIDGNDVPAVKTVKDAKAKKTSKRRK